ncbi:MAG: endonuclease/exonuclease/phosphatase family protein [Bacteroidales bacterium]|nr:endonuclease/exonuclease/phosphatase family protein [Bacteroidales bacterium]
MKKQIILAVALALVLSSSAQAQKKEYAVVFYNVENLYDTIKSPGVNDDEFLPNAAKKWNSDKYWKKMNNIAEVFFQIASTTKAFPAIIGVSEIENRNVLEDLVSHEKLARANYQIAHFDSPDRRGVDVALLYRPDQFTYEGSEPIRTIVPALPNFRTRDILLVWGTIEGEPFSIFVCHWPSRLGGSQSSEYLRVGAAQTVRNAIDSVLAIRPDSKIIVMGDLNDDPIDKSIYEVLGAKGKEKEASTAATLFNPFHEMFKKGFGTLAYNDAWNIFDNIIVNGRLLHGEGLRLKKPSGAKYYGNIFNRPFLLQKTGQFKNYPLRTFVGDTFMGGYSDHFPVFIYIAK